MGGTGTSHNGTGVLVEGSIHARFMSMYLDYTDFVLTAPIRGINILDGYFLGGGTISLRAVNGSSNKVEDLNIVGCQWNDGTTPPKAMIEVDESQGTFGSVEKVHIEDNLDIGDGYVQRGVRASKSLALKNATVWKFDFSDVLLFENAQIRWLEYSLQLDDDDQSVGFV